MTSIFHSDKIQKLLEQNNLAGLDSVFSQGETSYDRHHGRCVKSIDIRDENGQSLKLFLKLYWGRRRIWPRMTDIRTGQVFQSLAEREWNGLQTISDLGIYPAERMALFEEGKLHHRSAIIIKEVPVSQSLHELIKHGPWNEFTRNQKSQLIDKMLDTIQTIHSSGLAWRGASSKHFYPKWDEKNYWSVWLIDCEGVHKARTPKQFEQNYAKLFKSMIVSGLEPDLLDELKFKASYLQSKLKKAA